MRQKKKCEEIYGKEDDEENQRTYGREKLKRIMEPKERKEAAIRTTGAKIRTNREDKERI